VWVVILQPQLKEAIPIGQRYEMTAVRKGHYAVDPRLASVHEPIRLAHRPRSLDGLRVMLFDNGKLSSRIGTHGALFDILEEELAARYRDLEVIKYSHDLLVDSVEDLAPITAGVVESGAQVVIFALCDFGVSQLNVKLAADLEARGICTSLVCHGVGLRQAASRAVQLVPGLPLTVLDAPRWASRGEVEADARRIFGEIVGGLVEPEAALNKRFSRLGIQGPVGPDPSGLIALGDEDPTEEFTRIMFDSGLGDGLPLVAPFPERVQAMLDLAEVAGDSIVWPPIYPRESPVTAREVATLAVMAGCRPSSFRVVLAAYRAMAAPEFRVFQAAITTHAAGTLVLVSGPAAKEMGLEAGQGCLGPGHPVNATVGRAVALSYSFCLGATLGIDLSLQGSPAEYSYCCAEDIENSPWPGLHAEVMGPNATTVTVLKCEGPHSVMDNVSTTPERLLTSIASTASTLGSNNSYAPGAQTVVFLNLEHARIIASAGWKKEDVRRFLFETVRHHPSELENRVAPTLWPSWFSGLARIPVVQRAEDFIVVVAGAPGQTSQVALPWGSYSRGVTVSLL
jgi:hypothetical protein